MSDKSKGKGRGRGRGGRGAQKPRPADERKPGGIRKKDTASSVLDGKRCKKDQGKQSVINEKAIVKEESIENNEEPVIRKRESRKKQTTHKTQDPASTDDTPHRRPKVGYAQGATGTDGSYQQPPAVTPDMIKNKKGLPTPPVSIDGSPPTTSSDRAPDQFTSPTTRNSTHNDTRGCTPDLITPPRSTGNSPGDSGRKISPVIKSEFEYRDPPCRPEYGRKGRPIKLYANHFKVDLPRDGCIYHYDVTILPAKCPTRINRQVIWTLQERYRTQLSGRKLAFDGRKNIYTSKKLPETIPKLLIKLKPSGEDKEREFQVEIKYAAFVPLSVLQSLVDLYTTQSENHLMAIQALDVVMRTMSSMEFTTVGRSFFSNSSASCDLGHGRTVWFGRYQSIRPSNWGIVLNVDVSATAFYKAQPVLNFMCEVLGLTGGHGGGGGGYGGRGDRGPQGHGRRDDRGPRGRGDTRGGYRDDRYSGGGEVLVPHILNDYQRKIFAKEIKGLRVEVTHLSYPRKYKVKDVTRKCAKDLSFDCEGKQCTVVNYFSKQYGKNLAYPELPCLHMEGKNKSIYIPIECCKIVEQHCNRKLTPDQTSAMIRATAKPANKRKEEILRKLKDAKLSDDCVLNDFGVKVYNTMASVDGRVLDPPQLKYEGDHLVKPSNGQWDIRNERFHRGASLEHWAVVVFPRSFNPTHFIDELYKAGHHKGMRMEGVPEVIKFRHGDQVENVFVGLKRKNPKLQLIIAILDRSTSYSEVKRVGDNVVGVITQCVKLKNAEKASPSTLSNICLKINTKLNGVNSIINPPERTTLLVKKECVIIFGADVTHPAPGDKRSPSIAAVTASMDPHFMEYRAMAKALKQRQEVMKIEQLAPIIKDMLVKFRKSNGDSKPSMILFYRDGVSEGQFKEVIQNEVAAVQKACMDLEDGYRPGITFVVVQKRHHTRLFPVEKQDESGRAGNIPPGTVVDKVITHPREFDFFLCSHAGIQGTSKPCCYHVLWDDNRFTSDSIQPLTFQLCHCYARCTRSVSYPAPTYYSHLVAFRARHHLQDWEDKCGSDSMSTLSYSSSDVELITYEVEKAIELNPQLKDTMYFM